MTPIDQPQLQRYTPQTNSYWEDQDAIDRRETESRRNDDGRESSGGSTSRSSRSSWQLQNAEDSTAMAQPSRRVVHSRPDMAQPDPYSLRQQAEEPISPIPAPEDYRARYQRQQASPSTGLDRSTSRPSTAPRPFEAPQLPPRSSFDGEDLTDVSTRSRSLYREAAMVTRSSRRASDAPKKRDSTWFPVRQP